MLEPMRLSQLRVVPPPSTAYALSTADRKLTLLQSPVSFAIFSRYYLKEYAGTYFLKRLSLVTLSCWSSALLGTD
ncbi:hypothetical protein M422DRAFT_33212, partial [Sphaerobolus stellatus SS14]